MTIWYIVRRILFIWCVVTLQETSGHDDKTKEVFVTEGFAEVVQVSPNNSVKVILKNIKSDVTAAIFQVHTHKRNVTLSLQPYIAYDVSQAGRNLGVVSKIKSGQEQVSWYVFSEYQVDVLIETSLLDKTDPIPGGCNEEFKFEISPNMHIEYDSSKTLTMFQWGNHGNEGSCEDYSAPLSYNLYVLYLKENDFSQKTYFDGLKKMLTPQDIIHKGRKLTTLKNNKKSLHSKFTIESYVGRGAIYSVVVKDKINGTVTMAAYVPITTYSCDILNQDKNCHSVGIGGQLLATLGGIFGLFLVFLGHKFFKTGTFLMAFLAFGLVTYIVLTILTSQSVLVVLIVSGVCGAVLGLLWVVFWWTCGIHALTVLLTSMVSGYIISSIVFYTPMGNLEYWSRLFNYGMSFTVGVMVVPVCLLYFTKFLSIMNCAFAGSFLAVLALDLWLRTGIHMIVLNSLRHATNKEFITGGILVSGPFLWTDILLCCVWGLLFIGGTFFQVWHNKGQKDFPEGRSSSSAQRQQPLMRNVEPERQPLLAEQTPQLYGSNRSSTNARKEDFVSHPQ